MKKRRYFTLLNAQSIRIGWGTYYTDGGNCQVYMKAHKGAAWEFSTLADVLMIDGVNKFVWSPPIDETEQANSVWNRVDGAYNAREFTT